MPKLGDVLLIKKKWCLLSWIIRKFTNSNWNHCALYTSDKKILDPRANVCKIIKDERYKNKFLYETKVIRLVENIPYAYQMEISKLARGLQNKLKFRYFDFLQTLFALYKKKAPKYIKVIPCSGIVSNIMRIYGGVDLPKRYYMMTPEDLNKLAVKEVKK